MRGTIHRDNLDIDAARADFNKAIELKPKRKKKMDKALEVLGKLEEILSKVEKLEEAGLFEDVISGLKEAAEITSSVALEGRLAEAYFNAGDYYSAKRACEYCGLVFY